MSMRADYHQLYLAYLVYFNRDRDYFECHEVLEELWIEKEHAPIYKGLLQIAVGLYHFRNGNVRGAKMMLESAVELLKPYPEQAMGIHLGKLVRETEAYRDQLRTYPENPIAYYDLDIEIVDEKLLAAVEEAGRQIKPNIPQRRSPTRGKIYEQRMASLKSQQEVSE
ncbi:DUF309 domain-containing protein [Paenibacillus sp. JX-17]|uniref:DUF309 domain-containing protein n=1 Tax=Paenibacillus lacisoli TaxID=3064525 RepID=A0ABT9CBR4_9BACL|nr:DUF309 domain-containing protein [Paenibacillus sp. JX-17]MDO7905993.1 DUF309 domain-containing protein [Paenibacillus sp. JX-17]